MSWASSLSPENSRNITIWRVSPSPHWLELGKISSRRPQCWDFAELRWKKSNHDIFRIDRHREYLVGNANYKFFWQLDICFSPMYSVCGDVGNATKRSWDINAPSERGKVMYHHVYSHGGIHICVTLGSPSWWEYTRSRCLQYRFWSRL